MDEKRMSGANLKKALAKRKNERSNDPAVRKENTMQLKNEVELYRQKLQDDAAAKKLADSRANRASVSDINPVGAEISNAPGQAPRSLMEAQNNELAKKLLQKNKGK